MVHAARKLYTKESYVNTIQEAYAYILHVDDLDWKCGAILHQQPGISIRLCVSSWVSGFQLLSFQLLSINFLILFIATGIVVIKWEAEVYLCIFWRFFTVYTYS